MTILECLELALLKKGIIVERVENEHLKYPKPISVRFRWKNDNKIIFGWPFKSLMTAFLEEFYA